MNILTLEDYVECPQCGSDEEATYTELDGVIYIECTACGYLEEADFIECSEENEDKDDSYINSTAKKEQWRYYN